jgi:sRNA-binding protein
MTDAQKRPADLLPIMVQAFPHTFFADPLRVRPLKVNIDQDLFAALPEGVSQTQIRRFLGWYVHRPSYLGL